MVHLVHQDDCGIIIVYSLTDEADRIVGLEIGADDYVCKPFCQRELLARIRAVRRRVEMRAAVRADPAARSIIQFGKLKIDLKGRTVHAANGQPIRLTAAEFMVLKTMLAANGKAVSRDCLSEAALHHPWHPEDRSVDQLIFNLRQKLADGDEQPFIHSIRGAGYLLSVPKIEVVAKPVPIDQLVTPGVSTPIVGLFMPMVAHLSPIATAVPLLSNPL